MSEDEIIADGLLKIREGILKSDWNIILSAYNSISGEDLKLPEKKKTRLEEIRDRISSKIILPNEDQKNNSHLVQEEDGETGIKTTFAKGGKLFGREKIKIIQDLEDSELAKKNKEIASKTPKMRRPPGISINDKNYAKRNSKQISEEGEESGGFNFRNENRRPDGKE